MPNLFRGQAVFLLMALATPATVHAAEGNEAKDKPASARDVAELEDELAEIREEVGNLRYLLQEIIRLDRRRSDGLERALRGRAAKATAPARPAAKAKTKTTRRSKPKPPALVSKVTRAPRAAASAKGVGAISGRVQVPKGEPVAYVYVENIRGRLVGGKSVQIEQSGKQFRPRWAVIEKGTRVAFPNMDNLFHNVFSRSPGNSFDLGLYRKGDSSKSHRFIRSGPVDVYCNIHPRMSASILVVPNQYFAKVRPDGSYTIEGVPSGKRKVVAWAPGSTPKTEWVQVVDGQGSTIDLKLRKRSRAHKNKLGRPYGSYE